MEKISLETILVLAKFKKLGSISKYIRPILTDTVGKHNAIILLKAMISEDSDEFNSLLETLTENETLTKEEIITTAKSAMKEKTIRTVDFMSLYRSENEAFASKAKEIVVELYSNYIYDIIHKRYSTYAQEYGEELYQCGIIGLLKALETYDMSKGALTTFSQYFIYHEIKEQLNFHNNDKTVYYDKLEKKITEAIEQLKKDGFEPTVRSISIMTDFPTDIVKRELDIIEKSSVQYLDAMERPDVAGPYESTPGYILERNEREKSLSDSFSKLDDIQQKIIIGKHNSMTNQQIANEINISVGQVKKGYQKGIQNLRKDSNLREQYTDYIASAERTLNSFTVSPIISRREYEDMIDELMEIIESHKKKANDPRP